MMNTTKTLLGLAAVAVLSAVIAAEARKPAAERTWEGSLGGVVPYDLRPPTVERVRERMWAPDDERVIMPHVFGIGWTVNIGRIARRLGLA